MLKTVLLLFITSFFTSFSFAQEDEYLQSGDDIIHLTSYGEGQPVLIINGGPGMHSEGFKALAKIIGQTNKAIIYDQRGTGQSKLAKVDASTLTLDLMVEDIETIRNHFKVEK